jgi:hypothetical protein
MGGETEGGKAEDLTRELSFSRNSFSNECRARNLNGKAPKTTPIHGISIFRLQKRGNNEQFPA